MLSGCRGCPAANVRNLPLLLLVHRPCCKNEPESRRVFAAVKTPTIDVMLSEIESTSSKYVQVRKKFRCASHSLFRGMEGNVTAAGRGFPKNIHHRDAGVDGVLVHYCLPVFAHRERLSTHRTLPPNQVHSPYHHHDELDVACIVAYLVLERTRRCHHAT